MADAYSEDVALFTRPQSRYTGETPDGTALGDTDDVTESPSNVEGSYQGQSAGREPNDVAGGQGHAEGQGQASGPECKDEEPCAITPFDIMLSEVHGQAMEVVGFGPLQWILFVILGLGLMGDGIELLMIAYILPGAEKDLCMNEQMKGWLGAIAFAGMMVGAVIWGNMSDKVGRRPTLMTSLIVNAVFAIIGAFVPSYWLFLVCRFLSGLGIGGSIPVVMSYAGEFCRSHGRGLRLGFLLLFWVLGGVYVSALGWLIIPTKELSFSLTETTRFHSWRVFILICILPILFSIFGLCFMPESPRFLLQVGRDLDALAVYRQLYTWNHPEPGAEYEMPEIELPNGRDLRKDVSETPEGPCGGVRRALDNFWNSFFQLFYSPLTLTTVLLACVWFCTAFGYYGLSIWFPEYIKKIEQDVYFAERNITHNVTFANMEYSKLVDNDFFDNVNFYNVSFHNVELRHVTFQFCRLKLCSFQNVTSKKTYFIESSIENSVFNNTDLYEYKFQLTAIDDKTVFSNTRTGCQVDFDINYSSQQVFLENFISQLAVVPGTLLSAFLLDRVGRVKLLVGCLFISSVSVFFIWFTDTEVAVVCMNALFNFVINGAFNSIDVASIELYPTHLRSTAFGFLSSLGRIAAILGNVAFGNFMEVSKAIPILLTVVLLGLGGFISLKLPESKDKML